MAADKRVAVVRLIVKINQRLRGNKWLSTGRPGFMAAYTIQAWARPLGQRNSVHSFA